MCENVRIVISFLGHSACPKFLWKFIKMYPGAHDEPTRLNKQNIRMGDNPKLQKLDLSFLYATLDLVYICTKCHENTFRGKDIMEHTLLNLFTLSGLFHHNSLDWSISRSGVSDYIIFS